MGFSSVFSNIHYQENIDKKESQVFDLSNNQKTILKLLKQEEKIRKEIEI